MQSNTSFHLGRFVLYILVCLLLAGCEMGKARPGVVKATRTAVDQKALEAAKSLTNDGQAHADEVFAISAVLASVPEAYMLVNEAKELAVYAAPIVKSGHTYWQYTFLNTANAGIMSAERAITLLGGDPKTITTVATMRAFLSGAGFKELSTAAALASAISGSARLAIGFMKSINPGMIEVIVVPAYFFDSNVNPFYQGVDEQQ